MSIIPTGPMDRALTDKERKAVKAEHGRLGQMLQDDFIYWRRGLVPPVRMQEPKYTVDDLKRDRPDLYERTKLPKGNPDRLTMPRAKREARKRELLPDGIHYSKWIGGQQYRCSKEEAKRAEAEGISTSFTIVGDERALSAYVKGEPWPPVEKMKAAA